MDSRPKGVCIDCWNSRIATAAPTKGRWRPAPNPGPRCASHHRAKVLRAKTAAHEAKVQRVYGLAGGEYTRLLTFQGGVCAICQRAKGKVRRLAVDHDHTTQDIRGLLCTICNKWILGHGRDDVAFFQRVIAYLQSPPYKQMKVLEEFQK